MRYQAVLMLSCLVNLACVWLMYYVQANEWTNGRLPARRSLIPGTNQLFLYLQDFCTTTWGSMIALPPVATAFVWLVMQGHITWWQWILFAFMALGDALASRWMGMSPTHKPDVGYPDIGKASRVAWVKGSYCALYVAGSSLWISHAIARNLHGLPLYLALAGAALYMVSFNEDVKSGKFDSLRRLSEKA